MDALRFGIGGVARLLTYACLFCIVGNAVVQSALNDQWLLALVEMGAVPLTFFIYPFVAPADALAWPFADGTSLIPVLVTALIAYPISTFVGEFDPIG